MEGEYLIKTLLEFAEYWNTNNDIGSEEITKVDIKDYVEFTRIDTKRVCKYKNIFDTINVRIVNEEDYFLFTELFVLLHNEKDYCDCNN